MSVHHLTPLSAAPLIVSMQAPPRGPESVPDMRRAARSSSRMSLAVIATGVHASGGRASEAKVLLSTNEPRCARPEVSLMTFFCAALTSDESLPHNPRTPAFRMSSCLEDTPVRQSLPIVSKR